MEPKSMLAYRLLRPLFVFLTYALYRPTLKNTKAIPKTGPVLIAGNHIHALDPFLIGIATKRPVVLLAKDDLYTFPLKYLLNALGIISIDLFGKNPKAVKQLEACLHSGEAVGIFPEAARNYSQDLLLPFKYGTVVLAKRTGAPIVPFSLTGEYKLFRKGLTLTCGEAFTVQDMDIEQAQKTLREKIAALLLAAGSTKEPPHE